MKPKAKIKLLLKWLIQDHFPEFTNRSFSIELQRDQDYYMAKAQFFKWACIYVDAKALQLTDRAFTGLLAHELAHMIIDTKVPFFWGLLTYNETTAERRADMLVIERGLGQQLLQFHIEHNKLYKKYKANEGLTTKEIQVLLKKDKPR